MKGWLVVNGFLQSNKFDELYAFLCRAAVSLGIELEKKTSTELFDRVDALVDKPDFVLFWDKDYALAKRLENAGLRLFNSAEGVRLADDKTLTALALSGKVKTPKTMLAPMTFDGVGYTDLSFLARAEKELGYPMVVKEACGSFGRQVYLVHSKEELQKLVSGLGYKPFLLQEYIAYSSGRDLRVNVVGGRVLCGMLRENDSDFRSNITGGGKAHAYTPTVEQADAAVAACRALGLDFAGVDVLFGEGGEPLVCEVNSNPHFRSTYDCTGVDMSVEILRYIHETLL
ncbi:MAG: RimK family alpha-L-glutamate ligase [Clostridia bacterium]|nr:RimK family alpha-L-glutamate ligase [Clostridia bacterium]